MIKKRYAIFLSFTLLQSAFAVSENKLEQIQKKIEHEQEFFEDLQTHNSEMRDKIALLRSEMVTSAKQAQRFEARLSDISETLDDLEGRKAKKIAELKLQNGNISKTLMQLMQLSNYSPLMAKITPDHPKDVIHTSMVLRSVLPHFQSKSLHLQNDLKQLLQLEKDILNQKDKLLKTTKKLIFEREKIEQLITKKSKILNINTEKQKLVEENLLQLSQKAQSIHDLLDHIEKNIAPQEDRLVDLPKNLRFLKSFQTPAHGKLIQTFGRVDDEYSQYKKGALIRTRSHAQVVSPMNGKILFAGKFRSYGNLIIVQAQKNCHIVLAGFKAMNVTTGDQVITGEPLGTMGGNDDKQKLYLEIRHNNDIINPSKLLLRHKE